MFALLETPEGFEWQHFVLNFGTRAAARGYYLFADALVFLG